MQRSPGLFEPCSTTGLFLKLSSSLMRPTEDALA